MMPRAVRARSPQFGRRASRWMDRLHLGFDDGKVGRRLIGLAEGEVALRVVGHAP